VAAPWSWWVTPIVQAKIARFDAAYCVAIESISARDVPDLATIAEELLVDDRIVAAWRLPMELEQPLHHAVDEREVATDVRLHVHACDLGAEEERPGIARHGEVDRPRLDDRIDGDDLAAAATDHHERPHHPRVVAGGVAAQEHHEVGMLHVVELDGAGARADHARQADTAGLVAVEAAIVDVVGAVEPGEELQQEAGLIARPAAEIEERLLGPRAPQPAGDAGECVVPGDRPVVLRALLEDDRLDEPARVFELVRREGPQLRHGIGLEEGRLHGALHVGDHRLERLLAHLGEVAGLVDHAAGLAAHAERAGLAGVLRTHRPPERQEAARLSGLLPGVEHGPPAAASPDSAHDSLRHVVCDRSPLREVPRNAGGDETLPIRSYRR
jgi:hypothetical protein